MIPSASAETYYNWELDNIEFVILEPMKNVTSCIADDPDLITCTAVKGGMVIDVHPDDTGLYKAYNEFVQVTLTDNNTERIYLDFSIVNVTMGFINFWWLWLILLVIWLKK